MLLQELLPTLRLKLMNIGVQSEGTNWNYKGVNSPFSRLYLLTEGEAFVRHHGQVYHITPGTLHLVPCFTLSDYYCPTRFTLYYIQFTARVEGGFDLFNLGQVPYALPAFPGAERILRRLYALNPGREVVVCRPFDEDQKREFLKKLNGVDFDGSPSAWLESDGLFRQLLAPFLASVDVSQQPPSAAFVQLLGFIDRNLGQDLSLPVLARELGLQPTYFSDLFHNVMGVRPIEYVIRKRMERAQMLLVGQRARVKEVAAQLGFDDPAYFTRLFRKYTGTSPKDYGAGHSRLDTDEIQAIQKRGKKGKK